MTETLLTKCPHCSTTFRLTQSQLDIAGGAVRCGACYQVFYANEHIVKTAVVEEIRTPPAPRPESAPDNFALDSDAALDDYDTSDLELDTDENPFTEDYRAALDPEPSLDEFGYPETRPDKKKKGGDESWAEDLLKELGEDGSDEDDLPASPPSSRTGKSRTISSADSAFSLDDDDIAPKPKKKKSADDLSDTFKTLGMFSSDDPFSISDLEEEEFSSPSTNDDESWAKAMLDELEDEDAPKKKNEGLSLLAEEPERPEDKNPFAARDLARTKREAVQRAKAEQVKKPRPQKTDTRNLRNAETEDFFRLLEDPLAATSATPATATDDDAPLPVDGLETLEEDLKDETPINPAKLFRDGEDAVNRQVRLSALRFAEEEPARRPLSTALLVLGSLLLVLVLAGQYAYFNFAELSENPTMRPWLELVCRQAGCTLPERSDLSRIASTNLVVRSHPHEPNALAVDAIIKNLAEFEQPFPAAEIVFEDAGGNRIAGRTFQPREYVQENSADIRRMPPNTPIHLTLEIVDPGKQAVGYHLEFRAASPPSQP